MAHKEKKYVSEDAELMKEWDWENNIELSPYAITSKSDKKANWICQVCGYQWEASVKNRSLGKGCPKCAKEKRKITFNRNKIEKNGSLATVNPKLAKEWHLEKNGEITPKDVTSKSGKKVWWQCEKGHEWEAAIYSRRHSGCPICSGESRTSFPEQAIFYYLQKIVKVYNRYQIKPRTEIDI